MNEQQRAVVQQALDALEVVWREHKAIDGLRQLLEQPEPVQEPKFAPYWAVTDMEGKHIKVNIDTQRLEIYEEQRWAQANVQSNTKATLVYITRTTPPAQPASQRSENTAWVGLTDDEILEAAGIDGADTWIFETAYAIEAKLKEKNT
jgi:hypothetical protein